MCRIPMEDEELNQIYKEVKSEALALFHKKAVNSQYSQEYVIELKERIRQSVDLLRQENSRESEQACQLFLQCSY